MAKTLKTAAALEPMDAEVRTHDVCDETMLDSELCARWRVLRSTAMRAACTGWREDVKLFGPTRMAGRRFRRSARADGLA